MQWSTDITYDSTENTLGADLLKKWSTDCVLRLKKKGNILFIWGSYENKMDEVEDTFMVLLEITVLVEYFKK